MATNGDPLAFSAQAPKQIYQQLREHVREMIVQGALPAGAKLPSTKELATKWSVPAATVQAALTHLVKEGLLIRIRKKGTFVLDRNRRLERVGVYYDTSVWLPETNSFKRAIHVELLKLCESKGLKLEAFFDSRKPALRTTPLGDVLQAVESRQIQALIATDVAVDEATWIGKLPIPTAVFVEAQHPTKVDLDFEQFIALGLEKLKEAGCRSVGIISLRGPWKPSLGTEEVGKLPSFTETFSKLCREHDILTSDHWIRTAEAFVEGKAPQEEFGYSQFIQIWNRALRPDGLIVYPNSCSVGVITGVLEKRVDIPRQLKLVLHKHREIDYLCPIPVTFLYSSTSAIANALLQQIVRQFRGESISKVIIPFASESESRPDRRDVIATGVSQ